MFDSTDIDANIGDEVCDRNSNVRWRREQYSRGLLGKAEGLVESEYRQGWSALGGIGGIQENLNSRSGRRGTGWMKLVCRQETLAGASLSAKPDLRTASSSCLIGIPLKGTKDVLDRTKLIDVWLVSDLNIGARETGP